MDASWFSASSRCHIPAAVTARCILASSDWALSLRAIMWLCANFERQFGGEGSRPGPGPGGPPAVLPAYWILTSQVIMNQSNFANAASFPAGFGLDLHRVTLKYRETLQDIIQFAANFHLAYTGYQPIVVVLHGLDQIVDASYATLSVPTTGGGPYGGSRGGSGGKMGSAFKGGRSSRLFQMVEPLLCRALAVLRDALEHHAKRTGSPYVLCATLHGEDAQSEPPRYYYFVSRWLEELFECNREGVVARIAFSGGDELGGGGQTFTTPQREGGTMPVS